MPHRKNPFLTPSARKLAELSIFAPQVIAHRTARMALNGPLYPRRDQLEFTRMVQEKQVAFMQSWMAMWTEAMRIQQESWQLGLRVWMQPWTLGTTASATRRRNASAAQRIVDKGLAPIHTRARSNAKRLARTRLR